MKAENDDGDMQDQLEGPAPHRAGIRGTRRQQRENRREPLWQWNRIYKRGDFRAKQIPFTGNEGIQVPLPPNATPEDFFKLYIDENIIDHMVIQTNLYAEPYMQGQQNNLRPHSLAHQWKPTDRQELLAF